MLNENTYVSLETSAVNYLLDNFTFEELATIKDAYLAFNLCIITTTLFVVVVLYYENIRRNKCPD